ncbi:MAG TPA: hypothetical protein VFC19_14470, partial [Candidatus Limnocylindrales bacterium]|nr:hypothetical protein [Candidatus Limnocylindrales bacterium]
MTTWPAGFRPAPTRRSGSLDPVPGVRADLAANPAIGEELMWALAGDSGYDVRRRLVHNPAIPLDLLARLAPTTRIGATLLPRIAAATQDEIAELA